MIDLILNRLPPDDELLAMFVEARRSGKEPCEIVAEGMHDPIFYQIIKRYPKTIEYLIGNMDWLQADLPRTVKYLHQVAVY